MEIRCGWLHFEDDSTTERGSVQTLSAVDFAGQSSFVVGNVGVPGDGIVGDPELVEGSAADGNPGRGRLALMPDFGANALCGKFYGLLFLVA